MQKNEEFMAKAEKLASSIFSRTRILLHTPLKDAGVGTILSLLKLKFDLEKTKDQTKLDFHTIIPKIHEIILFGSVAEGKESPNDIDLMLFDNGHFSNFFAIPTGVARQQDSFENAEVDDWYDNLGENLSWLMTGWFGVEEDRLQVMLGDTTIDLHVLPIRFLGSKELREEITGKHADPDFFRHAFKNAMRFNLSTGHFEPLTLEYLEKKYNCNLADLR